MHRGSGRITPYSELAKRKQMLRPPLTPRRLVLGTRQPDAEVALQRGCSIPWDDQNRGDFCGLSPVPPRLLRVLAFGPGLWYI